MNELLICLLGASDRGMKIPSIIALFVSLVFRPGIAPADDATFDSNGVTIRYVTEGTGEPVVLIHGWMADSGMWGQDRAGKTKLKGQDGFRVIDAAKYGPEMAADVIRLLDHLKLQKAHLIGYSSGAFIAGHVAANHRDRVISVVYGGQAPVVKELMKPGDFSDCEHFAKAVEDGKGLGSYLIAVTPKGRPKPTEEQAKVFAKILYDGKDVKAFAAAGRGFKDLAVTTEQLKAVKAPVLFLHGGNESDHVKGRVATVHKLLGRGEVKIVEGGDHTTTLAKPEFGQALIAFLHANKTK
jgi:pimeloyl-ACP methyl ester carboxylesterase